MSCEYIIRIDKTDIHQQCYAGAYKCSNPAKTENDYAYLSLSYFTHNIGNEYSRSFCDHCQALREASAGSTKRVRVTKANNY